MRHARLAALTATLSIALSLAGCPSRREAPEDGGPPGSDAGPRRDGGAADAGPEVDGGPANDGGPSDDAAPDPLDAGPLDAAVADGGPPDAPAPRCGDGVANGTDECDGTDLAGATCAGLGFTAGALTCAPDCTLDVAACTRCGDGAREGTETCDGADLAGATCASQGFDSGTLACASSCAAYDTSACVRCGDGVRGGAEVCDGADLAGATCASQGFTAGTLRCATGCGGFDTSACTACGNGMLEAGEACDGASLGGASCTSRGFDAGTLGCTSACAFDESACLNYPAPSAGALVVNEVMPNPTAIDDATGEWFEVLNRGSVTVDLQGCVVEDNQVPPASFTIGASIVLAPGAIASFAKSDAPGFTPTYVYPRAWILANTGTDAVRILCGGTLVDGVEYTTGFPWSAGVAMQLDPSRAARGLNDTAADWCAATASYGAGAPPDRGTPGLANASCFPAEVCTGGLDEDMDGAIDCADTDCALDPACRTWSVGFCRLQDPLTITAAGGGATAVYGRVYVAGLTDVGAGNDVTPRLVAAVGVGPDGSDPSTATGWTWTRAGANPGYGPGSPAYEAANDEYVGTLLAPGVAGNYDFAYRFSGDGGATWTYCDGQPPGSSDGYQTANAGAMTVTTAATRDVFFSEYVEGTSNNKALEIYNGRSTALDLTTCLIRYYANGATTASSTLTNLGTATVTTLLPGDSWVICNSGASTALTPYCDRLIAGVMAFNGDDALELVCGGTTLDIFGQIGFDPGTAWGTGTSSTLDNTLRRACTVTAGDTNGADVFTPATEWSGVGTDAFADLGLYTCP